MQRPQRRPGPSGHRARSLATVAGALGSRRGEGAFRRAARRARHRPVPDRGGRHRLRPAGHGPAARGAPPVRRRRPGGGPQAARRNVRLRRGAPRFAGDRAGPFQERGGVRCPAVSRRVRRPPAEARPRGPAPGARRRRGGAPGESGGGLAAGRGRLRPDDLQGQGAREARRDRHQRLHRRVPASGPRGCGRCRSSPTSS